MKILKSAIRLAGTVVVISSAASCFAQQIRVPVRSRSAVTRPTTPRVPGPVAPPAPPTPASKLLLTVHQTAVVGEALVVTVTALDDQGNSVTTYKGPINLISSDSAVPLTGTGFNAGQETFEVVFTTAGQKTLTAKDTAQASITVQASVSVLNSRHCQWIPMRKGCLFTSAQINNSHTMADSHSFFGQIRSIYNGASSAATVAADVASLNFSNGMQVTLGTNIQAGTSTSQTSSPPQTPNTGTLPMLTAAGSAQAAQNMLYGGTFLASTRYPILGYGMNGVSNAGNLAITLDLYGREGFDIQNFKSGTSTQVTAPPSHTAAQMVGYLVYNAINPAGSSTGSTAGFAGSVFVGGSYGYSYTSHGYALDYGIPNVSNGLGQISAGIVVNNVVSVAASRGFGPTQTFTNSATNLPMTINNFKAWSIGITYQSQAK